MKFTMVLLTACFLGKSSAQLVLTSATLRNAVISSATSLSNMIYSWQAQTNLVWTIGMPISQFASDSSIDGGTSGATYINALDTAITNNCRQHGYVKSISISIAQAGVSQQIKFKGFRKLASVYTNTCNSEVFNVTGTGTQTFSLSTPLEMITGDNLGFWITGDANAANRVTINLKSATGNNVTRYRTGDITANDTFGGSVISDYTLCMSGSMNPPFIVGVGDSIAKGSGYNPYYATVGEGGGPTADQTYWDRQLYYQWRTNAFGGSLVRYQNLAGGSMTFSSVHVTPMPMASNMMPRVVFCHCGVNDISTGRTWLQVSNDLNSIAVQMPSGVTLMVDEIFPWTAGTDAQALTVRTWNTNLLNWCNLNNAVLLRSHDAMGQLRVSTGELDDMLTAYNLDNVHPNSLGVSNWCFVLEQQLTVGALSKVVR